MSNIVKFEIFNNSTVVGQQVIQLIENFANQEYIITSELTLPQRKEVTIVNCSKKTFLPRQSELNVTYNGNPSSVQVNYFQKEKIQLQSSLFNNLTVWCNKEVYDNLQVVFFLPFIYENSPKTMGKIFTNVSIPYSVDINQITSYKCIDENDELLTFQVLSPVQSICQYSKKDKLLVSYSSMISATELKRVSA